MQHSRPVYARVNTWKTTYSDVLETLTTEGFLMEDSLPSSEDDDSGVSGRTFMKDQHFDNLFVFSPTIKFNLYEHDFGVRWQTLHSGNLMLVCFSVILLLL